MLPFYNTLSHFIDLHLLILSSHDCYVLCMFAFTWPHLQIDYINDNNII